MEGTVSINEGEKVVNLGSLNNQVSQRSLVLTILFLLLLTVGISALAGYVFGKAQANSQTTAFKQTATTKSEGGKTTFSDAKEGYSIVFPDTWKATEKVSSAPGVLIESKEASVELWLRIDQPFSLGQEQKDAIAATNKIKLKINNKELEVTEYTYKTGGYFTIVVLPATTETPLTTFWIKAQDKEGYTTATEIVQSFKFS